VFGSGLVLVGLAVAGQTTQATQPAALPSVPFEQIRAELRAERTTVQVGEPVWVDFVLQNVSPDPVELVVPGAVPAESGPTEMGLPIEHIFSGASWCALSISDGVRRRLGDSVRRPPAGPVAAIRIAGEASVGLRLDVGSFYSVLREPGRYTLQWRPYGGLVKSNELTIRVEWMKQVVIQTDYGPMTVRLLYDKAPQHVANFVELAGQGFYNGLTFHRVVAGTLIQGGDPKGDGTGIRPDGKTLKPEFNDTPFEEGTVGMALAPDDPNSGSCQFFICLRRLSSLDGHYTAFGQVVGDDSLDVLRRIGSVQTDEKDRPLQPVRIDAMVVQPVTVREESSG
jgi:cyclophilin family peptidyl-prolyl cis-trans isomerase